MTTPTTSFLVRLAVALLALALAGLAGAATCTSHQDGNWSAANRWNCGAGTSNGPPTAADDAVINHSISLNGSYSVASVTVNGSLVQTGTSTRTLTVGGNFTNYGTVDDNGGSGRFDLLVGGNLISTDFFDVDNLTVAGSATVGNGFSVDYTFTINGDLTNNSGSFSAANLIFAAAGTQSATFYGTSTVGNLTVNSGTTVSSNNWSTLSITGDLANNGVLALPNSSFTFQGASAQTTSGNAFSVRDLTLNNASGLTLGADATVGNLLALSNGRITTGGNTLVLAGNCPGSVSGYSASRYVIGNLRLTFPPWNVTCVFPVGTGTTAYAPITVAIPWFAGIAGGTLTGSTTAGEHPQVASSGIDSTQDVNRYWSLGAAGDTMTTLPAGGSYDLTLGFVAADVDGGATVSSFKVGVYNGVAWSALAGSAGGTSATLGGQSVFGSYAVGTPRPVPAVSSINRASFDPTTSNTSVSWTVTFNTSVTGVDATDFTLIQAGGAAGAVITGVSGSGTTWTVTANTGTGTSGTLGLNLVDNDSIVAGATPLGGTGAGNGNFTGQVYTILPPTCTGATDVIFCDDFERSNPNAVGNGWTFTENTPSNCNGAAGNRRCAGIDSDIPPFSTYSNPRANPTRSMFTRWDIVTVQSPTIDLSGRPGAELSFWMRRGGDAFSEYPEATGENYLVRYRDNTGAWKILAQYPSGVQEGQVFTPTIELPADALHANFALQFYQPSGSGDSGYGGAPGVLGYDYWHLDNVIVRERASPAFVGAFCDNFEGGLGRWSISAEGAATGNTIGDASLGTLAYSSASHSLDLRWGYVTASTFKTDLTGVTGNITYWVRSGTNTTRDPDSGENLVVQYLNNTGTWTTLATYLGSDPAGTIYNGSHAIDATAAHANFRLRFVHLNASGYDQDYWHVDDVCVGDLVPTADLAITKTRSGALVPGTNVNYLINVVNNGPGTLSGSIQVKDMLPSALSYLGATGTGWTCSANGQDVTCNWSGTLVMGASAPTLTLIVYVSPSATGTISNSAVVTGTVVDNVPGNSTGTDSATIYVPSYVFTDAPCQNGVPIGSGGCNLVSWSPQTAGQTGSNVYVTAVNASGVPTQLSGSTATTVNFQFALSCHNPTTNGGVHATFSAVTDPLPLCETNGATPAGSTWSAGVNLSFAAGSPSVGPFVFGYGDVGQVELFVRNGAATSQIGQSGPFVVKPYSFVVTDIKCTTADADNCGAGALAMPTAGDNPGAADASGVAFIRAGHPFSAKVTAVNASCAASLGSYTRLVDIPVSCITPSYGRETTPETVGLTPALTAPLDCDGNPLNDPDCAKPAIGGSFGAFANGSATATDLSWGEVGIVTLTPGVGDGDYLGAGSVAGTITGKVGRFYPHHFDTEVSAACAAGGFTYSGQPFPFKAIARNAAGGKTSNYEGDFARVGTYSDANGAIGAFSPATLPKAAYVDGEADLSAPPSLTFSFTSAANADRVPVVLKPRLTDTDGASSATGTEQTTPLRWGRLRMQNALGAELLRLSVPLTAEYFTASGWMQNADDVCTTLAVPVAGACAATCVWGDITISNPRGNLAVNETSPSLVDGNAGLADFQPRRGNFGLRLSAPGAGNSGRVTVTTTAPAYLRYDWDNNGSHDNDPSAVATFGVNKSNFIFMREGY